MLVIVEREHRSVNGFITCDPGDGLVALGISVHVAQTLRQPHLCADSNHLFETELLTEDDGCFLAACLFFSQHTSGIFSLRMSEPFKNYWEFFHCIYLWGGGARLRLHKVERLLEEPPFNRLTCFSAPLVLFVQEILLA